MGIDIHVEQYDRDGYCLVPGVFDTVKLAELEIEFDRVTQQLRTSGENTNAVWDLAASEDGRDLEITHTHFVERYSAVWLRALLDPGFVDIAAALIGQDVILHHSKLFLKPPGTGAPFPVHQDWRYFPTADDSMLAAIIHLSPATIDMGCVYVHPGSHRQGKRSSTSGRARWDDPDGYRAFSAEHQQADAVPVEAQPGDVLFLSYLTAHSSGPNTSPHSRKTVLAQLYSGNDTLDPESEHPRSDLVLRGWNHNATRHSVART
ncbi:MAG: phytanoyl-CoA dioxygenase family protein [Actinomycetota bacterium]